MLGRDRINDLRTRTLLLAFRTNFHTTKSGDIIRIIADMHTKLDDISSTCFRPLFDTKTRTRIQNRLKFSPLLGEHWRSKETFIQHAQICVRVLNDTWWFVTSYYSIATTRSFKSWQCYRDFTKTNMEDAQKKRQRNNNLMLITRFFLQVCK